MSRSLNVGQMLQCILPMDAYSRRPIEPSDFHDVLYSDENPRFGLGDTFVVVERSEPAYDKDDVWYRALASDGSVVWLMECHVGLYFEPIEDCN